MNIKSKACGRFLVGTLGLALASGASADGRIDVFQHNFMGSAHTATITQDTDGRHFATVRQHGGGHEATILQLGAAANANSVFLEQREFGTQADIVQDNLGGFNALTLRQYGDAQTADADQVGAGNIAVMEHFGDTTAFMGFWGRTLLQQHGNDNLAWVRLEGDNGRIDVEQIGDRNRVEGDWFGRIRLTGDQVFLDVAQVGSDNLVMGHGTFSDTSVIATQWGDGNIATLTQQ